MPESNDGRTDQESPATSFLTRGQLLSQQGRFTDAIEMFLSAINLEPDRLEAHEALWETGLMRKAAGGASLGLFATMKLRVQSGSEKQRLLNFEKMFAYDPSNTEYLVDALQLAVKLDLTTTAPWLAGLLRMMNDDSPKPGLRL